MSANNWRRCPRCCKRASDKQQELFKEAAESYGKVPSASYLQKLKDADSLSHSTEALREDWQLGTNEAGKFYVSYAARCVECGFEHRYKFEQQLKLE